MDHAFLFLLSFGWYSPTLDMGVAKQSTGLEFSLIGSSSYENLCKEQSVHGNAGSEPSACLIFCSTGSMHSQVISKYPTKDTVNGHGLIRMDLCHNLGVAFTGYLLTKTL